ncbi:hypothetical protein EI94DRAFT_1703207 [Lactarius quietus]|nr:hypothetical protein EI94DRAFT_1703207 [Lactarius quietus]
MLCHTLLQCCSESIREKDQEGPSRSSPRGTASNLKLSRHRECVEDVDSIKVLYAFSTTLGGGVGLIFLPAQVIFAGVGVLLSAAKDVEASQDALVDLFGLIENFFNRLELYTAVRPTDTMTDVIVKIMVEVLNIFAIATKEMKKGRASALLSRMCDRWLIYVWENI